MVNHEIVLIDLSTNLQINRFNINMLSAIQINLVLDLLNMKSNTGKNAFPLIMLHQAFIMLTRLIDAKVKSFDFQRTVQEVLLIRDQRNQDNVC